ncbi:MULTISPECIES: TetR/AcrR family transcriptional regulator [Amycolatopsis]|uniref:Regulatory protein, tetR family n=2 Tax=Amycolatopsis TaxID=1813 RepID=A0A1I3YAX0_9PSEU|nr:TetR family transcriptional regulator [Amycolatopsis sacchari]SFK28900.1 regulatory protein, tetR family [Amycolatopsis sacchari]
MSKGAFLRARRPEHKEQRREAILAAARELALQSGVGKVSLGAVAEAVGLAKSNLARYFATREEIFLELSVREWQDWERAACEQLEAGADVVDALVDTIVVRPLFCDLVAHSSLTLEHNITREAARAFKLGVLAATGNIARAVARARPDLTERETVELVGATAGFASMLYPAANPPPVLAELYATDPEVAAACIPFGPTVRRAVAAIAAGLPALR